MLKRSCLPTLLPLFLLLLAAAAPARAGEKRINPEEAVDLLAPALSDIAVKMEAEGKQPALDYHGEGAVDGLPCHLFSFGEDTGQDFIAQGEYAVAHNGRLFKKDATGKYQPFAAGTK